MIAGVAGVTSFTTGPADGSTGLTDSSGPTVSDTEGLICTGFASTSFAGSTTGADERSTPLSDGEFKTGVDSGAATGLDETSGNPGICNSGAGVGGGSSEVPPTGFAGSSTISLIDDFISVFGKFSSFVSIALTTTGG